MISIIPLSLLFLNGNAPLFVDVAKERGLDFRHNDFRSGQHYYVETTGAGAAWLDADNDGDLDLYLINGAPTKGAKDQRPVSNRFFENRSGHFIDATEKSGLADTGFGMGVCTGDFNGDGYIDVFVTNWGADRLFQNRGDGRFLEVSQRAGVAGSAWGTNCSFGDLDGDGDLDLYVANYVNFSYENNPQCGNTTTQVISYCRPTAFLGLPDYLYINQGDGTFTEEAKLRGINQGPDEKGFGVVLSDLDSDGDLDIVVANDGTMNRLYLNDGSGHFEDQALLSGIGFNRKGDAEAGMGVDIADVDGNGWQDVIMTHYSMETNTLYLNRGNLVFEDATLVAGLAESSRRPVGWGVQLVDVDLDGSVDMAVANGHVMDNIALIDPQASYAQPNQLLRNNGSGRFEDISARAGPVWSEKRVSRGMAAGDYNNDGRVDLLITNINDEVNLLENRSQLTHHWVGIQLRGPAVNRHAIGARVQLAGPGSAVIREVRSGGSFLCQSDLRMVFGLGERVEPVELTVSWPDGTVQNERIERLDRYHLITYQPAPHKP